MEKLINAFNLIVTYGPEIISALVAVLSALVGLFLLIPGDEPETTLKKIVSFIEQFSRK